MPAPRTPDPLPASLAEPIPACDLGAILGASAAEVLACYRAFASRPPPEDARGFAAHHAACRAALAHLDLALRLSRRHAAPATGDDEAAAADALIARARAALDDREAASPDEEDGA